MADGRVLELDPILGVETLPGIAPPPVALGTRPIESSTSEQPLSLADARSFQIEVNGAALFAASEDSALEHGKHRR
ncbi:MAG TPA: hypothetical protein VE620_08110 [Myxococcales bacterium]|jgi:hypothetical protein|nr:hypothetical protein [Myxococcales bacterium]